MEDAALDATTSAMDAWIAVIVALLIGTISLVWYVLAQRPPPPVEEPVPPTKFETFVRTQSGAAPRVLFSTAAEPATIRSLLNRASVDVLHVDLTRIAGKTGILAVLRTCGDATDDCTEFLFENGHYIGSSQLLEAMYRSGELAKRLHVALPPRADDELRLPTVTLGAAAEPCVTTQLSMAQLRDADFNANALAPSTKSLASRPHGQSSANRSQLLVSLSPTVTEYPWDVMDVLVARPLETTTDLLTLPEPGWVDAAHTNGVAVLGTLTWSAATDATWATIDEDWTALASLLLAIAQRLKLDGWVVSGMPPNAMVGLLPLLRHSTSRVLWRTAETPSVPSVVDGLVWVGDSSPKTVLSLKKAFPDIPLFVHMSEHVDLQARSLRFAGVSISIDATASQDAFWPSTWRSLGPVHARRNAIATSFDVGHGGHLSLHGEIVSTAPWADPSRIDLQPKSIATKMKGTLTAALSTHVAYLGGTSLLIEGGLLRPPTTHTLTQMRRALKSNAMLDILPTDIQFTPRKLLSVRYSFLNWTPNVALNLVLWIAGRQEHLMLRSPQASSTPKKRLSPLVGRSALGTVYAASTETTHATSGWVTRTYYLGGQLWDGKTIVAIGVAAINLYDAAQPVSAHLGHLALGPDPLEDDIDAVACYTNVHASGSQLAFTPSAAVASTAIYRETPLTFVAQTRQSVWSPTAPGRYVLRPLGWAGAFLLPLPSCPRFVVQEDPCTTSL
ncbi:hypothetical protein SPRG_14941 [Saprolegnia parasitica CBS 223.65]|uniref:Cytosolic endo-beta-N-acetylglucosaminidase TIM barrel domain-containing protein n=1 Tax=Saprolegnia parasitica (strain CBS 223.65) TaxID=695850 RepID=A0A067BZV9_SAPPC|nr:hypothetical protein SPRG_14941 [Saprolegnia parasitica CBS 223.65]KDO19841.1 hypothetical protein SPRG_14941 [Saprolegnia parasitica CBS 223.65]|eukprot:XP_012209453.1 hypothetical protein SPRG_14941 [Saprolegnia parasitica CBS 223.65]